MATVAKLRVGPADHGRAMTLAEYLDADSEEGYRYELGRGVLEVVKVPNAPHGRVVCNLYRLAVHYELAHPGLVLCFGGGNEYQLLMPAMISGRNPDFALALHGTPKDLRGFRNPSLVAEVVSPRSRDRDYRIKREEYLAFGVLEYWIVDLVDRKMTVLVRDGDTWTERHCELDQPIPSLVLPGLATTPDDLWANVDDDEPIDADDE